MSPASFYSVLFASLPLVLAGAHIPSTGGSVSVSISIGLDAGASPAPYPTNKQCVRDRCARQVADGLRQYQAPARSSDCAALFKTVTVTPAAVTVTVGTTPSPKSTTVTTSVSTAVVTDATVTATTTETVTNTVTTVTTSSATATQLDQTTATFTTTSTTTVSNPTITAAFGKRGEAKVPQWACDCPDTARLSSACACAGFAPRTVTAAVPTVYLTVAVATPTTTVNVVGQTTVGATTTTTTGVEATAIATATSVIQVTTTTTSLQTFSTTSTTIATVGAAPSGTVGYCADGTVVDGRSTGRTGAASAIRPFRIEGEFETLYEGFILSGPQNITTPSGGTHLCDGTNNNANPAPVVTGTDQINDAGTLCGFDFDGTYSNQFQDFFITRIGPSAQTSTRFWGILDNLVFTPTGGCQYGAYPGSSILWAYDAFAPNRVFLQVAPGALTLTAGESTVFTVLAVNPNSGNAIPANGASFNGQLSDASGNVQFTAPTTPGTYRYKATRDNSIRSAAVVVTVTA